MEYLIYTYIFIFGTLFGSFSSVIIDRLKNKKSGIISGRSECPKCHHKLAFYDLFPIFSFLSTFGKCRYCKTKISFLYPILELSTGLLFFLTSYFLVDINLVLSGNFVEIYKLGFFLSIAFLSIVYVFYDILYLEIPDSILIILILLSFITISLQSIIPGFEIINLLPTLTGSLFDIGIIIGVGLIMISSMYFIMFKELKEIYDVLILTVIGVIFLILKYFLYINLEQYAIGSAILAGYAVFVFLFLQIIVSRGTWMGGGDLRIAIFIGLLAGLSYSFYAVFLSYLAGSIIGLLIIGYQKTKNHYIEQRRFLNKFRKILGLKKKNISLETKMRFGPFLAIGIYLVLFFDENIIKFIDYIWQ
ncbi:prepilin peptidase [Candidatus Gracilibacteria bacterium]|nr:prepilin peptidase [Candidatus Gracilibacteria bacterium]